METTDMTSFVPIRHGHWEPFRWVLLKYGDSTWLVLGGARAKTPEELQAAFEYEKMRFPKMVSQKLPRAEKAGKLSASHLRRFAPWVKSMAAYGVTHMLLLCDHSSQVPTMIAQRLRQLDAEKRFKILTFDGKCIELIEDSPRLFRTKEVPSYVYRARGGRGSKALRTACPTQVDGVEIDLAFVEAYQSTGGDIEAAKAAATS